MLRIGKQSMHLNKIYLALALVSFVLINLLSGSSSAMGNVRYVDSVGHNFLFRGEGLVNDETGNFDIDHLYDAIYSAGELANVSVPEPFFYIVDVNLLNIENGDDFSRVWTEYDFFEDNPGLGQLQYWPTRGTDTKSTDKSIISDEEFRDILAKNANVWLRDPLVDRVDQLRLWLNSSESQLGISDPIVIYVHCSGGCDRTGEMIGAYELRYMNMSWEEVNLNNNERCEGSPNSCINYESTRWYCLWLNQNKNFSLDCDEEFPCYV